MIAAWRREPSDKSQQLLQQLLSDLQGCESCTGEESCSCSTVQACLQELAALYPASTVTAPHHSGGEMHHYRLPSGKFLLVLCDELAKHRHSNTALLAASEAFYKLYSLRLFDVMQSEAAAAGAGNSGSSTGGGGVMELLAAAMRGQGLNMQTTASLNRGAATGAASTGQKPSGTALAASALQEVQTSAVVQQCVVAQVQPLFKQWRKVVKRMHAVLQKLPPGTKTFSPANALTLQQWLAEGPTSSSELSATINSSHVLLVWMAAVLRLSRGLALQNEHTRGNFDSMFSTPAAAFAFRLLPLVSRISYHILEAAASTHQLQAAGVSVGAHVPPAAAVAALECACLIVTDLGRNCSNVARLHQIFPGEKGTYPSSKYVAAGIFSQSGEIAFVCNAIIAAYGSLLFRQQQQQNGSTSAAAGSSSDSSSGGGDGGYGGSSSHSTTASPPPSGSGSLAQGLLLRRADRLQAKPDSWDQEFAGTHSRCWQQLYQQHWADLGFPPSLLHPVIDSLWALNSSTAGGATSSGGGSNGTTASSCSTGSTLQAVCAAVEVLLTVECEPVAAGCVLAHSRMLPADLVESSKVVLPNTACRYPSAVLLLGKLPLWLLPLLSVQLQHAVRALPRVVPAATDVDLTETWGSAPLLRSVNRSAFWTRMWASVVGQDAACAHKPAVGGRSQQQEQQPLLTLGVKPEMLTQHAVLLMGQSSAVLQQLRWLSEPALQQLLQQRARSGSTVALDVDPLDGRMAPELQTLSSYWWMMDSPFALEGMLRLGVLGHADSSLLHTHQAGSLCEQVAAAVQVAESVMRHFAAATKQVQGLSLIGVVRMCQHAVPGVALKLLALTAAAPDAGNTARMSPQQQQLMLATVSLMLSCITLANALQGKIAVWSVSPAHVYVVLLLALQDARAAAAESATETAAPSTPAAITTVLPPLLHAALTLLGRWSACEGQQLQQDRGSAAKWLSSTDSLDFLASSKLLPHLPPSWQHKPQKKEGAGVQLKSTCGQIAQQLLLLFDQVVQELPVLMQQQQQPGSCVDDGKCRSSSGLAGRDTNRSVRDLSPMGAADAAGGHDSSDSAAGSSSTPSHHQSASTACSNPLAATVVELLRTCTLQQLHAQHPSSAAGVTPPLTGSTAAPPPAVEELPAWLCLFGRQLCAALPSPFGCCNPSCANLATVSEGFALVRGKACVCGGCASGGRVGGGGSVSSSGQVEGETTTTPPLAARYCSVACQAAHWPQHKATCVLLRQAHQQEQQQQEHTEQTRSRQAPRGLRVVPVVVVEEEDSSEEEEGVAGVARAAGVTAAESGQDWSGFGDVSRVERRAAHQAACYAELVSCSSCSSSSSDESE